MHRDKMRKVLILKNINSKYIDEAIIFLKKDVVKKQSIKQIDNDFIIDESIKIINNYIQKTYFSPKESVNKKNKKFGKKLNVMIFISLALLIFLLTRAF